MMVLEQQKHISPTRLEAFSDGVIAIIITIMVLDLKVPGGATMAAFAQQWPIFLSYGLSYLTVAIYWVNHHHMVHLLKRVDTPILWANMLLLFCMSFVPFATAYMGASRMSPFSTALYCLVLLVCASSFSLLRRMIARHFGQENELLKFNTAAVRKNAVAIGVYIICFVLSFTQPAVALGLTFIVAIMYFAPTAWLGCTKEGV